MPWYSYERNGWLIAVDAISQHDAAKFIKVAVPGAQYQGVLNPPLMKSASMATAMVTPERDAQIRSRYEAG